MSNKTYDRIKIISLVVVPVFAWISSIVNILGVPYSETITAILTATDTLVGALVVIAKAVYEKKLDGGGNE